MWTHGVAAMVVGDLVRDGQFQRALARCEVWPRPVTQSQQVRIRLLEAYRRTGKATEAARTLMASMSHIPDAGVRVGLLRSLAYWVRGQKGIAVCSIDLLKTAVSLDSVNGAAGFSSEPPVGTAAL